jgi:hypothetical protein
MRKPGKCCPARPVNWHLHFPDSSKVGKIFENLKSLCRKDVERLASTKYVNTSILSCNHEKKCA